MLKRLHIIVHFAKIDVPKLTGKYDANPGKNDPVDTRPDSVTEQDPDSEGELHARPESAPHRSLRRLSDVDRRREGVGAAREAGDEAAQVEHPDRGIGRHIQRHGE